MGLLALSMTALLVYYGLSQALTPLFLEREFGLGTTERGLILAVGAAVSSLASAMAGRVGTRLRPAAVIGLSLPASLAGYVTLGLAPSLWVVGLGVSLVGLGYGSLVPVMMAFATSVGRPQHRGVLVGTYVSGNRLGMFAGPAVATAAAGGLGDRRAYLAGAMILTLVAAAWLPLRRLINRPRECPATPPGSNPER
jgi:MFS family permease